MYLVINKCVTAVKVSNLSGHYLRNCSTLDIGVLGYVGILSHKEHRPEVWHIPPGTPYLYICHKTLITQFLHSHDITSKAQISSSTPLAYILHSCECPSFTYMSDRKTVVLCIVIFIFLNSKWQDKKFCTKW